jgi:hypothetical protein
MLVSHFGIDFLALLFGDLDLSLDFGISANEEEKGP